jgi:Flp pilus assembly protein TadD
MSGSRRLSADLPASNSGVSMNKFVALVIVAVLAGCSTPSATMNKISLGMTKGEVVKALGQPESTRATQNTEFMIYTLRERLDGRPFVDITPHEVLGQYYVRLTRGHVDAYGQVGDFDSTHVPEQKLDIDVTSHGAPVTWQSAQTEQPPQPNGYDLAMQAGGVALSNKDYQAASASFQQATAMRPNSQQAWTGLGMAYGMLHEFPLALYAARKSVEIDSTQPLPLASLACIYAALGDTNKYVETLEKVRQIDPAIAEGAAEFVREETAKKTENSH